MVGYKSYKFFRKRNKLKYYLKVRGVRRFPLRIRFLKRPKWNKLRRLLTKRKKPFKHYLYRFPSNKPTFEYRYTTPTAKEFKRVHLLYKMPKKRFFYSIRKWYKKGRWVIRKGKKNPNPFRKWRKPRYIPRFYIHNLFLNSLGRRLNKRPKKDSKPYRKKVRMQTCTKLDFNDVSKEGGKNTSPIYKQIALERFYFMFYRIDYLIKQFYYSCSFFHSVRLMNLNLVKSGEKYIVPSNFIKKGMVVRVNTLDLNLKLMRKKFFSKWQYMSFLINDPYSQSFTVFKSLDELSIEDLRLLNVKRSFLNIHRLK